MPLFGLKNAKKKLPSSLGLRKTQSTGDIEDSTSTIKASTVRQLAQPSSTHHYGSSNSSCTSPENIPYIICPSTNTVGILRTPDQQKRPRTPPYAPSPPLPPLSPVAEEDSNNDALASRLRDITAGDMDLLLSLETQARMDMQEEKERKQQENYQRQQQGSARPTRLTFELPVTPPRSRSPDPLHNSFNNARQRRWSVPDDNTSDKKNKNKPGRLARWGRLIKQQEQEEAANNKKILEKSRDISYKNVVNTGSESSEEEMNALDNSTLTKDNVSKDDSVITVGSKVKLFKRPLPIIGTVKFIGKVHFDVGEWLGVELSSRVGNNDGKVDDKRYFQTNLHCGIFVKKEDAIKV